MKKITIILAHLVLIFGIITALPTVKSPSNQVLAYSTFAEESGGDKGGPDDSGKKPGSGPKEEPKEEESKSVGSTIWGWIKKILT